MAHIFGNTEYSPTSGDMPDITPEVGTTAVVPNGLWSIDDANDGFICSVDLMNVTPTALPPRPGPGAESTIG